MRQLAAILFADMAGYTALMQENEQLAQLKRKRLKDVLEGTIEQFNGKLLQYYGDGSLSIFNSALDSVRFAINLQQQLREEPRVELRMGIHTGDVTMEDGAIYGDGVNLASRIESLAVPGGIFISEKVFDEIKNRDEIRTHELGYFELKNVKLPVRVFAIANEGIVVPGREEIKGNIKQPGNRLAVLPFVNMSADPENEYFSDGITEELLNALTKVDGLQVISRTSAFAFKGRQDDIRDIATRLNVDRVLEGSVRKSGNRVRITAQLINASDGYHIWSENYDRNLTDIFEVQDEISSIIANKLRENLTVNQQSSALVKTPVSNMGAYTLYLKGLHFWNKITPADARKAVDCFEQAIAMEPEYAQAYAMTAAAYSYLGASGQMLPDKAFKIVHLYADRALQLDSTIAESHTAKASAYLFYDWKWKEAYEALQKAKSLNPGFMETYELLAFYHIIMGEKERAVQIAEEAEKMDPLSPVITQALGDMYMFAERYDDSIRQAEKVLKTNPEMRVAIEMKGWATGMKGDWAAALKLFEEVHRLTNHPLKGLMGIGFASAKLGDTERAMDCIHRMEQRQKEEPDSVIDPDLANVWYGLGNFDKCFYYLNQCVDKRIGPVSYYLEFPAFKELRSDPRYSALIKRTGVDK
jgi:TolB-like protein/Flp pilus assembly protein TadD